jgi:hypothetical protein
MTPKKLSSTILVYRIPDDILSAVDHLHGAAIFFRTASHPASWNVAS